MGDVVSYFHICYLYSNILLIVIPVKQVIEPVYEGTLALWHLIPNVDVQGDAQGMGRNGGRGMGDVVTL